MNHTQLLELIIGLTTLRAAHQFSNGRTRKNLQFAGDDGEDVVARNRPAEIHVGRSWQTQKHPS